MKIQIQFTAWIIFIEWERFSCVTRQIISWSIISVSAVFGVCQIHGLEQDFQRQEIRFSPCALSSKPLVTGGCTVCGQSGYELKNIVIKALLYLQWGILCLTTDSPERNLYLELKHGSKRVHQVTLDINIIRYHAFLVFNVTRVYSNWVIICLYKSHHFQVDFNSYIPEKLIWLGKLDYT